MVGSDKEKKAGPGGGGEGRKRSSRLINANRLPWASFLLNFASCFDLVSLFFPHLSLLVPLLLLYLVQRPQEGRGQLLRQGPEAVRQHGVLRCGGGVHFHHLLGWCWIIMGCDPFFFRTRASLSLTRHTHTSKGCCLSRDVAQNPPPRPSTL